MAAPASPCHRLSEITLISGLTRNLWAQRIWVCEIDVLLLRLILWMIYLVFVIAPRVEDEPPALKTSDMF